MGLSVQDEARCPKSGYSIQMLVHAHDSALETGRERRSGRVGAVEFDGPGPLLHTAARRGTGEKPHAGRVRG